jgi:uncharacterized protein with HEPN domain
MELNTMTYNELKDLRNYLINDYFYWLETIEDEYELDIVLDDIDKELKEVEEYMELKRN